MGFMWSVSSGSYDFRNKVVFCVHNPGERLSTTTPKVNSSLSAWLFHHVPVKTDHHPLSSECTSASVLLESNTVSSYCRI